MLRNSRSLICDSSMNSELSLVMTNGTKVLLPIELQPVYFLVILIGSQFNALDRYVRRVVPSGAFSVPFSKSATKNE